MFQSYKTVHQITKQLRELTYIIYFYVQVQSCAFTFVLQNRRWELQVDTVPVVDSFNLKVNY
jgi:hypothetical protein